MQLCLLGRATQEGAVGQRWFKCTGFAVGEKMYLDNVSSPLNVVATGLTVMFTGIIIHTGDLDFSEPECTYEQGKMVIPSPQYHMFLWLVAYCGSMLCKVGK